MKGSKSKDFGVPFEFLNQTFANKADFIERAHNITVGDDSKITSSAFKSQLEFGLAPLSYSTSTVSSIRRKVSRVTGGMQSDTEFKNKMDECFQIVFSQYIIDIHRAAYAFQDHQNLRTQPQSQRSVHVGSSSTKDILQQRGLNTKKTISLNKIIDKGRVAHVGLKQWIRYFDRSSTEYGLLKACVTGAVFLTPSECDAYKASREEYLSRAQALLTQLTTRFKSVRDSSSIPIVTSDTYQRALATHSQQDIDAVFNLMTQKINLNASISKEQVMENQSLQDALESLNITVSDHMQVQLLLNEISTKTWTQLQNLGKLPNDLYPISQTIAKAVGGIQDLCLRPSDIAKPRPSSIAEQQGQCSNQKHSSLNNRKSSL